MAHHRSFDKSLWGGGFLPLIGTNFRQLALLVPKLTPDALLLADNVLSHPDEIAGYLAALQALPQFDRVVVPIGKGLSVAYRWATA